MNGKTDFSPQRLAQVLDTYFAVSGTGSLYVGYSGGADSTALLHALLQLGRYELVAAHAHHGHASADAWLQHCIDQCRNWGIECVYEKVSIDDDRDIGWEASARKARYRWFASLLGPNDAVVTAHHQQDQAETVLAHLLRGSGVTGLSGIPPQRALGRGMVLRPLLAFPPEALRAYLRTRDVRWIEDPSNSDERYTRNLIRQKVLPVLRSHWPAANSILANTAKRMRDANDLLLELGEVDLKLARLEGNTISVPALRRLSRGRQANLLRTWLHGQGLLPLSEKRMAEVLDQLVAADPPPTALVGWGPVSLRRYRDHLYLVPGSVHDAERRFTWDMTSPLRLEPFALELHAIRSAPGQGLAQERLTRPLSVRWRRGGEICRLPGRQHHSRLKKLLQDAGVPPWQRDQIPLLYCGDELAAVVGYWYCAPYAAQNEEPGTELVLKPSSSPAS